MTSLTELALQKKATGRSQLLSLDEWHPLDQVAAPEYIPDAWDGPHVGVRLVEAFKTLSRMPMRGVMFKSGMWPEYGIEWADLNAREQAGQQQKDQDAREQNRVRIQPTARDITRMEDAIIWPGRYLAIRPIIGRTVMRVAWMRATRDYDLERIARRLKLAPWLLRNRNRDGLDAIAVGLRANQVPLF